MHHFRIWRSSGLSEIWVHHLDRVSPFHEAVGSASDGVVQIIPAVHSLTGCDTISKVGTKLQGFKAAHKPQYEKLKDFGIAPLEEEMYRIVEIFLLECMTRKDLSRGNIR